jgi:hypothetical protein
MKKKTPFNIRSPTLIVCVLIRYLIDLTGGPDQVYMSGIPDSEWLALHQENFLISVHLSHFYPQT